MSSCFFAVCFSGQKSSDFFSNVEAIDDFGLSYVSYRWDNRLLINPFFTLDICWGFNRDTSIPTKLSFASKNSLYHFLHCCKGYMWFSRFGAWLHHLTSVSLSRWQGQFVSANRFPSTTRGNQFMDSQRFGSSCSPFSLTQFQLGMLLSIVKLTFYCMWITALNFYPSFRSFCAEVLIVVILSTWYKTNFWKSFNLFLILSSDGRPDWSFTLLMGWTFVDHREIQCFQQKSLSFILCLHWHFIFTLTF